MRFKSLAAASAAAVFCLGMPAAHAQTGESEPAAADPEDAETPAVLDLDPATVPVPDLAFTERAEDVSGYEKYYYFVRPGNDFVSALSDLHECDGYARGLSYRPTEAQVPYPYAYTIGGAIGGAIGNAMADAIFGSSERRKQRRLNMRTCMAYKGYKRFGLSKEIWTRFNFEEGNSPPSEVAREKFLRQQAKIASGPMPAAKELGR
jgi:hypothetical protein